MKKNILILIALLCLSNTVIAQISKDKIDTIYYNNDRKVVNNKAFADYYRIAYYPADSTQQHLFRDFYMNGDLKSSGCFEKIDSLDDKNTIFVGACTTYFKNGNENSVVHYENGILNGDYKEYDENGLVKQAGCYLNGKRTGLLTQFQNDGQYTQIEYINGIPKYDYYVLCDNNGFMVKRRISDDSIIWESPSIEERNTDYRDGVTWQYYSKNGLIVALTSSTVKDYGKWHRIDLVINNNSLVPIEFDPVVNISAASTDEDNPPVELEVWSSDEYLKKVNRAQTWAAVLVGVSEGLSAASAGYSSSTTTSHYSGNAYSYGSTGYTSGGYYGSFSSITNSYNAMAAYQANVISQQRMANFSNAMAEEQHIKKLGYLKKNTIYPGDAISGYVLIKRIKGDSVYYVINIEGAEYTYSWSFGK